MQLNTTTGVLREMKRIGQHNAYTRYALPKHWKEENSSCKLFDVAPASDEWKDVERQFKSTLPNKVITNLQRIQNRDLWDLFQQRRERMRQVGLGTDPVEVSVWHGTGKTDPKTIYEDVQDGFMTQYSNPLGMWGRGLYFAVNSAYSDEYAFTTGGANQQKSFMLTQLLVGECTHLPSDTTIKHPPSNEKTRRRFDTISGDTGGSKVYIVYENGRAYPDYLVTYHVVA